MIIFLGADQLGCHLSVVYILAILFLTICKSSLSRTRNSSFDFRVVLCRIRLFPKLISKIKWLGSGLPLRIHEPDENLVRKLNKVLKSLVVMTGSPIFNLYRMCLLPRSMRVKFVTDRGPIPSMNKFILGTFGVCRQDFLYILACFRIIRICWHCMSNVFASMQEKIRQSVDQK